MRQIEINAIGPMLLTQQLQPLLHEGDNPIVLNVSSQLGSMVVGGRLPLDVGYNAITSARLHAVYGLVPRERRD